MTWKLHIVGIYVLLLLGNGPTISIARSQALLVGVSQYPSLDRSWWLEGPRNDVQLFRNLLATRGFAPPDINILADGVAGAKIPTRNEIFSALDRLAATTQRGDFVFILFAGHGSQQPSADSDRQEPDGMDEIFLPSDIGRWDGDKNAVKNAILDNELGAAIGRIRARGAFVWAAFDTCHSGTLTRAAPSRGERSRQLLPARLGIPSTQRPKAAAKTYASSSTKPESNDGMWESLEHGSATAGEGGLVAFFAAQSEETTPEALLPMYTANAVSRGLFSYALYQAIAAHPNATYRQIVDLVLQSYQAMGRQNPTPSYEGNGLDNTVFGSSPGKRITQWRIERSNNDLMLRAGLIDFVTDNSVLAVFANPTVENSSLLGYVKVANAKTTESAVVPIAYNNRRALSLEKFPVSAFARPEQLRVDATLRISTPDTSGDCDLPTSQTLKIISELRTTKVKSQRIRWVAADEPADVRVCQYRGDVLLLDSSGTLIRDPRVRHTRLPLTLTPHRTVDLASTAQSWTDQLHRIARVTNLIRLATVTGEASKIRVSLTWLPGCANQTSNCISGTKPIRTDSRPFVHDDDRIKIAVRNPSQEPVDLTILYVDANFGISTLFPDDGLGESPRVGALGTTAISIKIDAATPGFERLLIIAVPAQPQSAPTSFAHLARSGYPSRGQQPASGSIPHFLEDAVYGLQPHIAATSAIRRGNSFANSLEMTVFGWFVMPRP